MSLKEERKQFRTRVKAALADISQDILAYNEEEFWMIQSPYEYIEYYAVENQLFNTAIALPLARGLHNGTYRKSSVMKNNVHYKLPYVIHCLIVTRILLDINISLSKEEQDILLAASLCHDMIEDIPFLQGGTELYTRFHLDPRVYHTVKLVSKRHDFTPEEERDFFHHIESDKLALLVKLSDRSHNVEDLYNMSVWKVHEYIDETKHFFIPMCKYGLAHYPELWMAIEILEDKIMSLTSASVILVDRYEERQQELQRQVDVLKEENARLREEFNALWEG